MFLERPGLLGTTGPPRAGVVVVVAPRLWSWPEEGATERPRASASGSGSARSGSSWLPSAANYIDRSLAWARRLLAMVPMVVPLVVCRCPVLPPNLATRPV